MIGLGCVTHSTLDIPLFTSHVVLQSCTADPLLATSRSIRSLVNLSDLGVVRDDRTVLNGRHDERNVHSGVVVLTCTKSVITLSSDRC